MAGQILLESWVAMRHIVIKRKPYQCFTPHLYQAFQIPSNNQNGCPHFMRPPLQEREREKKKKKHPTFPNGPKHYLRIIGAFPFKMKACLYPTICRVPQDRSCLIRTLLIQSQAYRKSVIGSCTIVQKGQVTSAHHSHNGLFFIITRSVPNSSLQILLGGHFIKPTVKISLVPSEKILS